ncbi:MAG: hypothetical protein QXI16_04645, partial [Sulfolobaceae archaeon]
TKHDCKTTEGLTIEVTEQNKQSLVGRYIMPTLELITNPDKYVGKKITIRSPLFCRTKDNGLCSTCYGKLSNFTNVGIIAAQTLGERSTQLIMKTFHTGGKAKFTFVTEALPDSLYLENTSLFAKKDVTISVSDTEEISFQHNSIIIHKHTIMLDDTPFELPFSIQLLKDNYPIKFQPDMVVWKFNKNQKIGNILVGSSSINSMIENVQSLLRTSHEKDPTEVMFELYDNYAQVSKLPLVHFEVLYSTLTRQFHNQDLLWRYDTKTKPIILSLKQTIAHSAVLNLFFENPGRALENLLNNEASESPLTSIVGV